MSLSPATDGDHASHSLPLLHGICLALAAAGNRYFDAGVGNRVFDTGAGNRVFDPLQYTICEFCLCPDIDQGC